MSAPETPAAALARALAATGQLVEAVREDQWSAPTPCSGWTVRELLNHLVGGNLAFAAILTDQTPPDRAGDHLGDDPTTAYRQASAALLAAFAQPGVLDRVVTVSTNTSWHLIPRCWVMSLWRWRDMCRSALRLAENQIILQSLLTPNVLGAKSSARCAG